MSKALEILKGYPAPTPREESVLNEILERLGQGRLAPEDAVERIMERLDWPLDRAAAEVDAFLD